MSDHCGGCRYEVKARGGEGCCPFNPLYWHFLDRHRELLAGNPRMAQMYRTWDRMTAEKRAESLDSATKILARLDAGERI
jgi:deoxyribodipyrimidine photolyase-related protein